jgi:hypothetical protein
MKHDPVKNPSHYDLFPGVESMDIIKKALTPEQFAGFLMGNCLKYRLRAGKKGETQQDIDKALWYENRLKQERNPQARKRWPTDDRINIIGQNGNNGEHY